MADFVVKLAEVEDQLPSKPWTPPQLRLILAYALAERLERLTASLYKSSSAR